MIIKAEGLEIYTGARNAGKTTAIIQAAKQSGRYIICRDVDRAAEIMEIAQVQLANIRYPITFAEFRSGSYFAGATKSFIIENGDKLLQEIAGDVPVEMITIIGERNE